MKKMEFSKKIFMGITAVTIAVVMFACIIMWRTMDTSPLQVLIPAIFAELATATGFYFNKAKTENKIKIEQSNRYENRI